MAIKSSDNFLHIGKGKALRPLVAIIGRLEPKTGGEFYNRQALTALADELGEPLILQVSDLPTWIQLLDQRLKIPFYILGNVWFSLQLILKRPSWCYLDFYMYPCAWLPMFIVHFLGGNVLVVVHDLYHVVQPTETRKKIQIIAQKLFLNGCDVAIATSRDTFHRLHMELKVPCNRIKVIYPGVETGEHRSVVYNKTSSGAAINILFVGMVKEEKRVLDIVKAATILTKEGVKLVLHIAGRTDVEPKYTEQVWQEAARGSVELILHGFLPKRELDTLYSTSHIFVLPSKYETFGMVVVEAMRFGLPIVATCIGGIPELITHGKDGLLFTPGDMDGLTENLRHLCLSLSLRKSLGRQAKSKVATLPTWKDMHMKFRSIVRLR